jgi:hypothetical protein
LKAGYIILLTVIVPILTELKDQSLSGSHQDNIRIGTLQQFVDNAESSTGSKVLRVIHAPSDFVHQLPFTTEYLAWRETRSLTYCKEEDNSMIGLLRWNDFSNADAVQSWRLVPHGFGAFFDVHAGSQWMAVSAPLCSPFDPSTLATPDIFSPEFSPDCLNDELIYPEAILLTEGTRM